MLLLDVNVVLAAHREDHAQHAPVRAWFDGMLSAQARFAVPAVVWGSFLRLATSRRVFEVPTPRAEAFAFVEATCAQPAHLPIGPGPRHLPLLRELCDEGDASGDLVADAVIAALAAEHGAEVVTLDRDFARFPSVSHRRPAGT
ncbi:MAG TPA: type II toxin-antitoxin system VapC family toxin [Conexibacter sp.]|nr:type II toxin-antitoxin system VapC family toxin [Conexibacter sp.]